MSPKLFLVFDVESVGIHGDGFAFGYVVVDTFGAERAHGLSWCDPLLVRGDKDGMAWVENHVPEFAGVDQLDSPQALRDRFWEVWDVWAADGAQLVADCPWPVEARFLLACVADAPSARMWSGPYPFIDVASVRLAARLDPLGTNERVLSELPMHNPLADARQSARLLIEALGAASSPGDPTP